MTFDFDIAAMRAEHKRQLEAVRLAASGDDMALLQADLLELLFEWQLRGMRAMNEGGEPRYVIAAMAASFGAATANFRNLAAAFGAVGAAMSIVAECTARASAPR